MSKFFNLTSYGTAYNVRITVTRYANNGNLALSLETDEDEPFATMTVNTYVVFASKSRACVDTNNCPWAKKFIEEYGLGVFMGEYVKSGYCEYPVYEFFLDKINNEL